MVQVEMFHVLVEHLRYTPYYLLKPHVYTKLTRCLRFRIENRWDGLQSRGRGRKAGLRLPQAHEEQP